MQKYIFERMEHYPISDEEKKEAIHSPSQVLLFMGALIFLCMMLGSGIIAIACSSQGIDFNETISGFGKESSSDVRNFMRGALLINHLLSFLVPALLTGYVFFRKKWAVEVGIRHAPPISKLVLGVLLTVMAFPLAQVAFTANRWIVEKISWLQNMVAAESASENLMEGLLVMPSPWEMIFSLVVMAVIPAIGEEMVFRGILQKQMQRITTNPYTGILVTALIFSLAHFQIQRFFAIFLLGVVLGLIFYWTKNLWVPIAGHFVFNGTQVVAAFFSQEDLDKLNAEEDMQLPFALIAISLIAVFFISKKLKDG
ncbi:MAG: type II CAAX endopeptidase family protein [Saprospiraceae bacterium]